VFILGSPRSGTSVLAWALARHSRLWTSGESHVLSYLYGGGRVEQAFQKAMEIPNNWFADQGVGRSELLASLGVGMNALFTSRSQGKRWVDQTPGYTLMADVLAEMFPGAQFLHILRDGRRVVHSMVNFLRGQSEAVRAELKRKGVTIPWLDFREACKTWRLYVERALAFCARHPSRCLTVVNERLVEDPEQGFQEVFDFLHVPREEAPAAFFRSNRINSSFQGAGGPTPYRLSEPWAKWGLEQVATFREEAEPLLASCGFVGGPHAMSAPE
jgi:hypothetical protein